MNDVAPLNSAVLDEHAAIGLDGLRELIDLYVDQAEKILSGLREAVRSGAAGEVRDLAHRLVGSSSVCGVDAMVAPLRALEARGREGQLADAEPLVDEIARELGRCRALLEEYLNEKQGPAA